MLLNILSPPTIWIRGRCYRTNAVPDSENGISSKGNPYSEADLYESDHSEDDCDIVVNGNNGFKTTFDVPRDCFGMIIGARGATKRRIEAATKTQINIPRPGGSTEISIVGLTPASVSAAKKKIDVIVLSLQKKKPQVTHFLCIPFNKDIVIENFLTFKSMLLSDENIVGLNESYFQNPLKLHLTIEVLSIKDEEGCILAAKTLENCCQSVIRPLIEKHGPIEIHLKGLDYMNDDPANVHVLYAAVECDIAQKICDSIANAFVKTGLLAGNPQRVKMHVTVMNSSFSTETGKRKPIDCSHIINKYKSFSFGTIKLTEIHLSEIHTPKESSGFYPAITIAKVS